MKLGKRIWGVLTLVFLSSLGSAVFAQRQEITKAKFDEVMTAAARIQSKEPFRTRYTEEPFNGTDTTPTATRKAVVEFIRPDRAHYIFGPEWPANKKGFEHIVIGAILFKKTGDADWVKTTRMKPQPPYPVRPSKTAVYYALPHGKIDGKEVKMYEVETVSSGVRRTGKKYVLNTRETYWVGMDGRYLRIVKEQQEKGIPDRLRHTWTYEYDPTIKIEAPVK